MDFFNFNTFQFDITKLVEEYQGKKLDEFFPNNKVIENKMGEFLEIRWEIEDVPYNLNVVNTKKNLLTNLKAADYIGDTRSILSLFRRDTQHISYRAGDFPLIFM